MRKERYAKEKHRGGGGDKSEEGEKRLMCFTLSLHVLRKQIFVKEIYVSVKSFLFINSHSL